MNVYQRSPNGSDDMDEIDKLRKQFEGLDIGIRDKNGTMIKAGDRVKDQLSEGKVVYVAEHASFLVLADDKTGYHRLENGNLRLKNTEVINSKPINVH